jgi:tetratricopeptide (TPR) repeat protein
VERDAPEPSPNGRRWSRHLPLLLIAGVTVAAYANALPGTFHLDDFYRVRDNPEIARFWPPWRHFVDPRTMSTLDRIAAYRPLLPLSLSVDHALWGGHSALGYHLTNLALQLCCALLVFLFCRRLLQRGGVTTRLATAAGLGVALIFAVHPVSGIGVNYICARDLLLMQLLLLLSLLAFLRATAEETARRRWWWAAALAAAGLSLLAKPNALVLPLLVLLLEWTVGGRRLFDARAWARALPFAVLVGAFFALTRWGLGFSDFDRVTTGVITPTTYALTQAELHLLRYLRNAFWPWLIRQDPWIEPASGWADPGVLLGLAAIAGTLALAWVLRRRVPLLALCIAGYWLLLAPTSSVVPFHHLAVDYRPYPASVFCWLAVALGVMRLPLHRLPLIAPYLRPALLVVAVIYFGAATAVLNRTWRSEETLWRHSIRHGGGALAHLNLAMAVRDLDQRVALLRRALQLSPGYVLAHVNLCLALIARGDGNSGQTEEGLGHCRRAVTLAPGWAQAHHWLGRALEQLGHRAAAARALARAAALDPRNLDYQYRAALGAQLAGDVAGSLPFLQRVRAKRPDYGKTGFLYGYALQRQGRLAQAIAAYRAFLRQHPDHARARHNLKHALTRSRQPSGADQR